VAVNHSHRESEGSGEEGKRDDRDSDDAVYMRDLDLGET